MRGERLSPSTSDVELLYVLPDEALKEIRFAAPAAVQ
jgi:hypothetical protein